MAKKTTEVEKTTTVPAGKTVLSINLPTPMWATWMFRIEFVITKMLTFYLAGTQKLPAENLQEYILIISTIDLGFWAFGRLIGVEKPED